MQKFRQKLNELSKVEKILLRLAYPILLYIILHFSLFQFYPREEKTFQFIFIIIWAFLEWYFFLSYNMKKHREE
jgi:hypothetical protein